MNRKRQPKCKIVGDEKGDIYIVFDGVRIAKRGLPGTPQAKAWIVLEPGYTVYDEDDNIIVEHTDTRLH